MGRGGGGLQNRKIAGPKLVVPPPLRRGKIYYPPPCFKGLFPPPVWLKLQAPMLKLPQNLCPPFRMQKNLLRPPPSFCRGKTSLAPPPLPFCCPPPPPLPVIDDHSLIRQSNVQPLESGQIGEVGGSQRPVRVIGKQFGGRAFLGEETPARRSARLGLCRQCPAPTGRWRGSGHKYRRETFWTDWPLTETSCT